MDVSLRLIGVSVFRNEDFCDVKKIRVLEMSAVTSEKSITEKVLASFKPRWKEVGGIVNS